MNDEARINARNNDGASTQTLPPPVPSDLTADLSKTSGEMLVPTKTALEHFADRRAKLLVIRGLAIGFVVFVVGMVLLALGDQFIRMGTGLRTAASVFVDALAIGAAWIFGIRESRTRDWTAIARRMESATPALRERMLSAVELGTTDAASSSVKANGSAEFRRELQNQVADQVSKLQIARMLPWGLVRRWTLIALSIVLSIALLSLIPSWQIPRRLARVMIPMAPIERASMTKIEIVRPAPPTRSVAEGDLVAVAASISHLGRGSVYLEWRSDDGGEDSLVMSPRDLTPLSGIKREPSPLSGIGTDSAKDEQAESFAVNVQVHQMPIHYRIIAGDGETLWHTLTPQPRPKMVSFEKRYQFPAYSKLPELLVNDQFGDLAGIVGTRAEVTVKFDQPVHQVELLFGGGRNDTRVPVSSLDDSLTQFRYLIPIKTPGSYRVDAVSRASELNNPFSPRFSIDPMIDRPPTAVWSSEIPSRQIVSSAAVIDLAGTIEDDLPMDTWVQQVVLDNGRVIDRSVPVSVDASIKSDLETDFRTRSKVSLKWDMMKFTGRGEPAPLPPGSQIKTRLIALDRAGNRGASEWIHVFIAGDEFDASRHDELRRVQLLSRQVRSWFDDLGKLGEKLIEVTKVSRKKPTSDLEIEPAWQNTLDGLRDRWSKIGGWNESSSKTDDEQDNPITIENRISKTNDSVEADRWALLNRYVAMTLDQLQDGVSSWILLDEQKSNLEQGDQDKLIRQGIEMINRSAKTPTQIAELSQWILSIELAAGLMRDLEVIRGDAELLSKEDSKVPVDRLPGQADLLVERLREVGDLAESMQMDLPNNTVRHQERLHRYLTESMSRIERENQKLQLDRNSNVVVNFQKEMARIAEELRYHLTTSLLQGDTFNQIIAAARDMNRTHLQNYRDIEILRDVARDHERAMVNSERARENDDTEEMKSASANEEADKGRFDRWRRWAQRQFEQAEEIERSRKDMSVQTASDWKLIDAVIQTVTEEQFKLPEQLDTPENQSTERILDGIRKNASVLESGNQFIRLAAQLQDLTDRERYGENRADGAVRQGARLEHYQAVSETPLQVLQASGLPNEMMEALKATRWDKDFQQARQWTTSRRYDSGPFVSASAPVQTMVNRVRRRMPVINVKMAEAREMLRAFLPTTGELARDAAEESGEAAEQSREAAKEENKDSEPKDQATPPSKESMEALQEKVDALAENLADRANTADYEDEAQRELARDADAALAKIKEQMDAVAKADAAVDAAAKESPEAAKASDESAAEEAETLNELSETLETLTDTLDTTAEHFDAADQGESVESTREALREGAPDSDLQMAADSAEATNRAANASPEELLERLEDRLDADATMQRELAEISQQTAAAAEQAVRTASKQEKNLRQELERVDSEFAEKKREIRDQLKSLSDQAKSVNDHWLSMTESVSGWDKDQESRVAVRQARDELNQAIGRVDQVQNDQALLNELEEAADQLRSAINDVVDQADQVQKQASERVEEKVYPDDKSRQQKARQLEQSQLQAKNRWLKALSDQTKDWKRRRDDAGRRVQTAQNQERNAERQLQQAKKQLDKHPDEEWAQKGFQESEQRVQEAKRAGEQAKQTRESAEKAEKEASNRLSEERRNSVKDLKENNPASELLARVAEKSSSELERISESLKPMSDQSDLAESLSPPASDMKRLAEQQSQTSQTIEQAAGDLERAARHEDRLGNQQAADELKKAAEQLQATLNESMQQAQQSLQQAAQDSENSDPAQQAGEQLSQAAEQLAAQADQLADLQEAFASQDSDSPMTAQDEAADDRNGAAPADPSPMQEMSTGTLAEANRSEKLARTLDELDRGINQQPAEQGQPADAAQQGQSSPDGEAANSQDPNGQNPSGQSPSSKPTAGDASPTLAASAQQAIRDLAAQRQQQVQQIASAGQPSDAAGNVEGDPSSQSDSQGEGESGEPNQGQDGQPGTVSGDGSEMPGGGLLNIADQGRVDEEWGMLREQKNGDVIQDRKSRLPMSYRPAIEAYFQAISAEAARATETRATETRAEKNPQN